MRIFEDPQRSLQDFHQGNVVTFTIIWTEVMEEMDEGDAPTDRSVVSREELLLSQWPFHPPLV